MIPQANSHSAALAASLNRFTHKKTAPKSGFSDCHSSRRNRLGRFAINRYRDVNHDIRVQCNTNGMVANSFDGAVRQADL